MKALLAVDLAEYRRKVKAGERLDVWESIVAGKHPALLYPWKTQKLATKRIRNTAFKKSSAGGAFTGVVTNVRLKHDKNGNLMAFFGMLGAEYTFIEVIAFSSLWGDISHIVKAGRLLKVAVEKQPDRYRGWSYLCGDRIKWYKKGQKDSATDTAAA
jgi:DNA polymerase III alpha subunit